MTLVTVLLLTGQMQLSLGRPEKALQAEQQEKDRCQPYVAIQHLSPGTMASLRFSKEQGFSK